MNICGYSFCSGKDALNPVPTNLENIKELRIQQGIFDHVNVSKNVAYDFSNVLKNSSFQKNFDKWANTNFDIVTKDGENCAHAKGVLNTQKSVGQSLYVYEPDANTIYTVSADFKLENYVAGKSNPFVGLYPEGNTNDGGTNSFSKIKGNNILSNYELNKWQRATFSFKWNKVPSLINQRFYIYARDFTGDLYIKNVKLEKGNVEHTNWTPAIEDLPIEKDEHTILDCGFDTSANAGNIDIDRRNLKSLKLKRRKKGDLKWTLVEEIPLENREYAPYTLNYIMKDYYVPSGSKFEWALVPEKDVLIRNKFEERIYAIDETETKFNGIFISDLSKTFKLTDGVAYSNNMSNQSVGRIATLNSRFPIITRNGNTDYESGSVSGLILNDDFNTTGVIDRNKIVKKINEINSFLKNGKPKIVKDWNGNVWICQIVNSPSVTYQNNSGMGIVQVRFDWVECGKYDVEEDLYKNGLLKYVL